ncbi:MAG: hypothetical protein EBU23_17815 [Mycobacteriaceae bacterium]|nr:hypothetical protein [Mycobacteriaceae bacterium]NBQ44258.1 hypothetical protein [Mycobacteriaceae bacterium]
MAYSSSPVRAQNPDIPAGMIRTGALVDAGEAIDGMANQPVAAPVAAKIVKLSRWAAPALAGYNAERMEIVRRYGVAAGGEKFTIPPEHVAAYNAAIEGLRAEPTAAPPADLMLRVSAMGDVQITPATLVRLEAFVRD